jgi:hypothetical protein
VATAERNIAGGVSTKGKQQKANSKQQTAKSKKQKAKSKKQKEISNGFKDKI